MLVCLTVKPILIIPQQYYLNVFINYQLQSADKEKNIFFFLIV